MQTIFDKKISKDAQKLLEDVILISVNKVKSYLDVGDLDFTIQMDISQVIPQWGVGGYFNENRIELFIEGNREQDWIMHLPRTIFHELHHFTRSKLVDLDKKLIDLILSEGLAQHFEVEIDGKAPSFFSNFLSDSQRNAMLKILKTEYNDGHYNHARWFFGKGEFPFQGGYDLSYFLVEKYLEKMKKTSSQLIDLRSDEFLHFLGW